MALSAACYQPRVQYQCRESSHHGISEILGRTSPYLQGGWNVACLGVWRTSCLSRPQNYHRVSPRQEATSHDCVKILSPALWLSNRRGVARAPLALPSPGVEGDVEEGTPWEGAIVFRRSAVQSRFDYSTTLERLGLSRFSSEKSMALATEMGLEKSEIDGVVGTPVQVSVDFKKEGRDYRIDGIIRTSLALLCNRCLAPVAERIYASFNLLLTEVPVLEPTQQNLGVVLGDNVNIWKAEAGDDAQAELDIDLDDKIHFPRDQKEVDLSKYLRDTIHLEIPTKSLCDSGCPGVCFGCGVNLNSSACLCGKHKKKQSAVDMEEISGLNRKKAMWSPLEQLKKQLEEQENRADDFQS